MEEGRMQRASSLLVPSTAPRCCTLTSGARVVDVADACRSAALGFAWNAREWSRRELAQWLIGPYAHAVAAARPLRASGMRRALASRELEEAAVHDLLARVHEEVLADLRESWSWKSDPRSARAHVASGLVGGIIDDASNLGFAPIDQPGMSLFDRVRSLFLADYLTRPGDYAAFFVCSECDGATFDGAADHVDCTRRRPNSVLRRRADAHEGDEGATRLG